MSGFYYGSVVAGALTLLAVVTLGDARAGSVWLAMDPQQIVCDVQNTRTCTVAVAWSVSNQHKYDLWKICWKPKESATWLDDHCDYNVRYVAIDEHAYAIPGLKMGEYYRVKLEGRRERNGNWTCLHKGMIRSVGYAARFGGGGICVDF